MAKQVPFYSRWFKRFTFQSMDQRVELVVRYEPQALDTFLKEMAASIDSEPVNADIRLEGGRLAFSFPGRLEIRYRPRPARLSCGPSRARSAPPS